MTIKANFKWKYYLIPIIGLFHLLRIDVKITSYQIHNMMSVIQNHEKITLETDIDKLENNFWVYLFVCCYMFVHIASLLFLVSLVISI